VATTPNGLAYPLPSAAPNGAANIQDLAVSLDHKVIGSFATAAARAAAITAPNAGDVTYRADASFGLFYERYTGSAWIPMNDGDTGWITPTLGNSWVSFDAGAVFDIPQYRLRGGVVWLKGAMKSGTISAAAFTLPAGYRPLKKIQFAAVSNAFTAQFSVFANGDIQVTGYATGGSNAFVSLNGVQFIAEQ
jgi:hypothetical protein